MKLECKLPLLYFYKNTHLLFVQICGTIIVQMAISVDHQLNTREL
jgi:hypothetical protein